MLTQYTTFDEVRAVLGVSDEELEDEVLIQPFYERQLILDIEDVDAGIPDAFDTVSAIQYASRTKVQKRFFDLVQLFSAYAIGRTLLTSMPYFAELRVQDGRSEKERVKDPFAFPRDGVQAGFTAARQSLLAAYAGLTGTPATTRVTRTLLSSVGLATDPVTNT